MKNKQSQPFTVIRNWAGREAEIAGVVQAAFAQHFGSGDGEVALVSALRTDGDVVVEMAAEAGGEILGHVMFSRMTADPPACRIAALAPVAVRIDCQNRGIGEALIRAGLAACRENGVDAVIVLGDPKYYGRFGFAAAPMAEIACAYAGPHLQALEFRARALGGIMSVTHAAAFARMDG